MALKLVEELAPAGYERLVYIEDEDAGLRAFVCVHSTVCGPAVGGCRMWNYASKDEARTDVLRLAAGMTHKNAMAGLGLGGGKSVILGDPRSDKSEALFRAFGRAIESFGGSYYTAEDVGISPEDMAIVAKETSYAVGLDHGAHASGDPSPFTAEGVFQCLKIGARAVFGTEDLTGRRVLVQGLGHVGWSLAEKLHAAGAALVVTDVNAAASQKAQVSFGAEVCAPDEVFDQQIDIFAPCALGGVLTHETVARLSAKLVCGAANNQLLEPSVAEDLLKRDCLYLPDYVVNAGGIISVAGEVHHAGPEYRAERLVQIARRIDEIVRTSRKEGKTTIRVADEMVTDILAKARKVADAAA
ncbi:Leu/Phe/Val dehydrogenase [Salipiger mangrovisoli]|uniref:Glu/Leu/Phe/Val dehydrogenase n=1 Tax=Salipiger mangrovisoli TaxID=2865933 RepID=A0ABR9X140_9RHOB|nr:Glu/Leu/Phe/Val dehydrogenase [Salipiger mangrovisoli]MBE9637279.1 Glu/Leu/Phe/Val dehydrogenase [Salipiger mangrovisoli]